jgi:hypothetical protein
MGGVGPITVQQGTEELSALIKSANIEKDFGFQAMSNGK